ncbi:MAG: hypothetical protein NC206_07230 [Bacteroides sp.]|nr:hypothetical protein [Roseburia sp.]MCM1346863.1 hypothetical protein [Bacteroides sp.]MCM1420047.1 hypothetical protein [Bacteroides sp.]
MSDSHAIPPFSMPMFRQFVPESVRPWIYVCFAFMFQLSGGVYLGALSSIFGSRGLLREDVLMCMYSNLIGMSMYFPVLFRMKFRFTNKTLLMAAASVVLVTNVLVPFTHSLPILWFLCFIEGAAKIQGTFECMSNIQLWMTPKRDFRVFFPLLHIFILVSIQVSGWLAAYFAYVARWEYMHFFVCGLFLVMLITQLVCLRFVRIMPRFPLYAIDWLGAVMWSAFFLQATFVVCYGDHYDWFNSPVICNVTVSALCFLVLCVRRMLTVRHAYFEFRMFRSRTFVWLIVMVMVAEMLLSAEYILEEVFYEAGTKYTYMTVAGLRLYTTLGILVGCMFSLWWLKVKDFTNICLIAVGMMGICVYYILLYVRIADYINIELLYLPVAIRGFSYAVISATLLYTLETSMNFKIFFQSLGFFNVFHTVGGAIAGCAIYTFGLNHYVADNMQRYGEYVTNVTVASNHHAPFGSGDFGNHLFRLGSFMGEFVENLQVISIKQLLGWASVVSIAVAIVFLCMETSVRSLNWHMPDWKQFGKHIRRVYSKRRLVRERMEDETVCS